MIWRLPSFSSNRLSLITGIIGLRDSVSGRSVFADILVDLVILCLAGVDSTFGGVFPASGDEGNVDILLLVLRPTVVSSSCTSLLTPRFLARTLPPLGGTFRRDRVIFTMV